ncbi:MAG: hypothetical protein NVS2B14_17570 [Chamaesiphon sp.]
MPTTVFYTSNVIEPATTRHLSIAVAVVLIVVYILTLVFSLGTHSYLYQVGLSDIGSIEPLSEPTPKPFLSELNSQKKHLWLWIGVLLATTTVVAIESELLVGSLKEATAGLGFTPLFTGVILLPLIGSSAEYVTAVRVAIKNNMELAVSVAMGSSLLSALFVAPLLVLVGQAIGQPMDLDFDIFQVVAVVVAVAVANLISLDGRSNWLEGTLLLATYTVLGLAFYFHPV